MNILWLESSKTKNYFQRNDVNIVKVIFCDVIRCSFGVYNSILLKSSIKIFDIPNAPIHMNYYRKDSFFKGTKTSKNKNIVPHQSFTNFTEALVRQSAGKKMFLKISQNSLKSTSAKASFLIKLHATFLKKGLWHRCFLGNFTKLLRPLFLIEYFRWLLMFLYIKKSTLIPTMFFYH